MFQFAERNSFESKCDIQQRFGDNFRGTKICCKFERNNKTKRYKNKLFSQFD